MIRGSSESGSRRSVTISFCSSQNDNDKDTDPEDPNILIFQGASSEVHMNLTGYR